jgi:hypothetical protein
MELTELAFGNLKFLLELEKDDVILSNRRNFYKQDEFVQVENIQELEHTLYFTFTHLLHIEHNHGIDFKELLNEIDEAINKVYENTFFNKLLEEDKEFSNIIQNIDDNFREAKDEFLNKTICNRMMDKFVNFSVMIGHFMRVNHLVLMEFNGIDYNSGDDTGDDSGDDSGDEGIDEGTGEENPNLIYSDDDEDSDDDKKCN